MPVIACLLKGASVKWSKGGGVSQHEPDPVQVQKGSLLQWGGTHMLQAGFPLQVAEGNPMESVASLPPLARLEAIRESAWLVLGSS